MEGSKPDKGTVHLEEIAKATTVTDNEHQRPCLAGENDNDSNSDSGSASSRELAAQDELTPSTSGREGDSNREARWEARRVFNNLRRRERVRRNRAAKSEAARAEQQAALSALSPEELARLQAEEEAVREARCQAHEAQQQRLATALAGAGLRVVVDCSYAQGRPAKELRSLAKQIEITAALNKRAPAPAALTLCAWGEPLASASAPAGSDNWRLNKVASGVVETYGADKVVVLSPDASEPLLSLDHGKVYVIGGIVDRTVRKGLTLKYAEERQLASARLPIAEHAEQLGLGKGVQKCPVLNINDVMAALLEYCHSGDWVKALDAAIPHRKRKPQQG